MYAVSPYRKGVRVNKDSDIKIYPDFLYHYTSLSSLALIINNRTICFNNLLNVDDIEEAESSDIGLFGKYINVSCWTDEEKESIAMWSLYTPDMHGVRIKLPVFPFEKYHYSKGKYHLGEDVDSYIDIAALNSFGNGSITLDHPKLQQIQYVDDEKLICPAVRTRGSAETARRFYSARTMEAAVGAEVSYSFKELGVYKRSDWKFQKEWRYIIHASPMGLDEMYPLTFQKQQELIRRIENVDQPAPFNRILLKISDCAFKQMEVLFGPKMTQQEKILAVALLEKHGLSHAWSESRLRIK